MNFLTATATIVWKDLQIEQHTRQTLSVMIMFSLVTVIMFNFALSTTLAAIRDVASGLLLSVILLAGTLGLTRSLGLERENQTMDALLIAPIDRQAIYAGKVISISLFTLLLEAFLLFIFTIFFNKPFLRPQVGGVLFLVTIGYIAAGVLVTSMTIQTKAREVLLPVLLLPLTLPLVLPAAVAVAALVQPELPAFSQVQSPLALVALYDLLMLTAGFLTYHYVVES